MGGCPISKNGAVRIISTIRGTFASACSPRHIDMSHRTSHTTPKGALLSKNGMYVSLVAIWTYR